MPTLAKGCAVWVSQKQYEIVGQILGDVRRQAGVTQGQLAKRLKKPQSFISAYEAGQRRIDVPEFIRVVEALDSEPLAVFAQVESALAARRRRS